jgi:simple sugar transport system permease protein
MGRRSSTVNNLRKENIFLKQIGNIKALPVILVLVLQFVCFLIFAPRVFSGYRIYMSFFQTVPPQLVLALGLTLVITAGEIDLSFASVVAFSGFVFSYVFRATGLAFPAFLCALLSGALVGVINGLLIARLRVPSIMATLASNFFWGGLTVLLCGGLNWSIKEIRNTFLHTLFVGRIGGVFPAQALWGLGLAVLLWFILNRHRFGEAILFIGDNTNVARVMGINVEKTKIILFTVNGVIAGFAAVLLTLEITNFYTTQGQGFLLPVMAAVFIGGTSISGGEGTIVGTFFGMYIIGSLEAGVVATGIGGYWVRLTTGLVMAASVIINVNIKSRGKKILSSIKNSVFFRAFKKE